ncbi:hypothetical protein PsYK624_023730 [Phanerochaete sordida]|uniref:Uncharacterized protein n=1 Tax=Phanerochaete sordida TaxID=48140 RepID=A0A9P3L9T3_9APHY|nr:hypothetical protein PsYK624_023730 [Phanerochaete sordida]
MPSATTNTDTPEKMVQTSDASTSTRDALVPTSGAQQSEYANAASQTEESTLAVDEEMNEDEDFDVEDALLAAGMEPRGAPAKPTSVKASTPQRPVAVSK